MINTPNATQSAQSTEATTSFSTPNTDTTPLIQQEGVTRTGMVVRPTREQTGVCGTLIRLRERIGSTHLARGCTFVIVLLGLIGMGLSAWYLQNFHELYRRSEHTISLQRSEDIRRCAKLTGSSQEWLGRALTPVENPTSGDFMAHGALTACTGVVNTIVTAAITCAIYYLVEREVNWRGNRGAPAPDAPPTYNESATLPTDNPPAYEPRATPTSTDIPID